MCHCLQGALNGLQGNELNVYDDIADFSLLRMPLQQQGMFLDAATVLLGQPAGLALAVWRAWHGYQADVWFRELERHCLVDVDERGRLRVHDLVAAGACKILLNPKVGTTRPHWLPLW